MDALRDAPESIAPYVVSRELNEPILVAKGPFRLAGPEEVAFDTDLMYRWLPSPAVEFDGSVHLGYIDLNSEWSIVKDGDIPFRAPIQITQVTPGPQASRVEGLIQDPLNLGGGPIEVLRFSLVNFPSYLGESVKFEKDGRSGLAAGRLHLPSDQGLCQLDVIWDAEELRGLARKRGGFFISHVGRWLPADGSMTLHEAESVLDMLHVWFGFLRGAWAGPLFPQGLRGKDIVWRQFADWKLRESRNVPTWLPERRGLDLSDAFSGFARLWNGTIWRGPLRSAISWLTEANRPGISLETKVIIAQVALELLSWVRLVEDEKIYEYKTFDKMKASERIHKLLVNAHVPAEIPDHLVELTRLCRESGFSSGPEVISGIRNKLVHATEQHRVGLSTVNGLQFFECAQLAIQYIELVLLAICGYRGHYARRGWSGWKGDDEVLMPWSQS